MDLLTIGDSVAVNPKVVTAIKLIEDKGALLFGNNHDKPIAFLDEPDFSKVEEMLEPLLTEVIKSDKDFNVIALKHNAFISADVISTVNAVNENFIINSLDGEVLFWLSTGSDEEAKRIRTEVLKAVDYARKKKRYSILWDVPVPTE